MADPVESALSAAADTFEASILDPATRAELVKLLDAGQKPYVLRPLSGLPGRAVMVMAGSADGFAV